MFEAPHATVAFDVVEWIARSDRGRPSRGGGWAKPCPPLFPDPSGRHLQRAFRDMLADLLPPEHGWLPTLRIAGAEVKHWIHGPDAVQQMRALLHERLSM